MLRYTICILIGYLFLSKANAQQTDSIEHFFLPKTNYRVAIEKNLPYYISGFQNKGIFMGFYRSGIPKYYLSHNLVEAKMSTTNYMWNDDIGYNGSGMKIALWDGGSPRKTHEALKNKVEFREKAYVESYHSTHVAGTLAGRGIDSNAKGMSYKARIISYDYEEDEKEMVSSLLKDSLLVSNHSYGFIGGWAYIDQFGGWTWWGDTTVSSKIDYKYGYYDEQARDWDIISYNNPYYLMLKSSGNDRGRNLDTAQHGIHKVYDKSADQWVTSNTKRDSIAPFDCINGSGVGKNTLTVGSIRKLSEPFDYDKVEFSKFSCTGPADDGRIKPDLVGVGEGVYSALEKSDSDYGEISGTSMSTPHVAGSLLLLQQKYQDLFGGYMLSSTLKGLVLHHARDLGNPGPDYTFGWGLLDMKPASEHISQAFLKEKSLIKESGINLYETQYFDVYLDGNDTLKVTLCWSDTAGEVGLPALNDRTPKLVNNLDLSVMKLNNNQLFFPYILNPDFPDNTAVSGINDVDNVEKIENISQKGWYRVVVNYKASSKNVYHQDYSLLVSGFVGVYCTGVTENTGNTLDSFEFVAIDKSFKDYANIEWNFIENGNKVSLKNDSAKYLFSEEGEYEVEVKITDKNKVVSMVCNFKLKIGSVDVSLLPSLDDTSSVSFCENTFLNLKDIFRTKNTVSFSCQLIGKDTFNIDQLDTQVLFKKNGYYDAYVYLKNTDGIQTYSLKNYLRIVQKHPFNIQNMLDSVCENNEALLEPSPEYTEIFFNNKKLDKSFLPSEIGTGDRNLLLKYENKYGCKDSMYYQIFVISAPPVPNITRNADELTTDGSGVITWYLNDRYFSNDRTITITQSGIYKVGIKTSSDGCETFSERKMYFPAGIKNTVKNNFVKIFPNPSNGKIKVGFEKEVYLKNIEIYNVTGSLVKEIPIDFLQQNIEIDTDLPQGIYYLNLISENGNFIEKIIIR